MKNDHVATATRLFDASRTLHECFESQVQRTPHAPALIYQDETISYATLNQKSNQLAQYLRAYGANTDTLVGLCLDRSPDMLIAIFGILKSGAAYLPIDVDYPAARRDFMVADGQVKILLTQSKMLSEFSDTTAHVVCMDSDWMQIEAISDGSTAPKTGVEPHHLAYTIYTSGSTGTPKGVMIEHRHILNQLQGQQLIAPAPIGGMVLTCSISFDVSVLTIFWTLLQGAPLILPPQGAEKDITRLQGLIHLHQATHLLTLPSLHTLILENSQPDYLTSLRLINVSGEVCPLSLVQKHEKLLPDCQLYNLYGPTEAAVNCTYFKIPKGFSEKKVPIGIPIFNYEMFILDNNFNELGEGETGEIYIGGSQPVVGRGYWNRLELTAQKFIANPYQSKRGGPVLYRTGDLGRWQKDGNIEFLGRTDFQVKYNGFRIELGEVETVIGRHSSVKETVVLLRKNEDGANQKLVAYVTGYDDKNLNISELKAFIQEKLPEYMQPSHWVVLDEFPLTTNGKFDRKALPTPSKERPDLAQPYEAPVGKIESYIANIWSNILEIQNIGRHDKFFELGGTSILAARFLGVLQKDLRSSIFVTTIFDHPTIATYAELLEEAYAKEVGQFFTEKEIIETPASKVNNTRPTNTHSNALAFIEEIKPNTTTTKEQKLTAADFDYFKKYIPDTLPVFDDPISTSKNKPAVFILAPPRSGTTLLRVMLDGHPALSAFNELQLLNFKSLADREKNYSGKFALWKEGLVRAIMELDQCNADAAQETIDQWIEEDHTTRDVYGYLQSRLEGQILIDKTPHYAMDIRAMEQAEQQFENPIYIHLVRHPYAAIRSFEAYKMDQVVFVESHNYSGRQLGELVWQESHKNIVQFLQDIPKGRHIRVQYEDLVQQPELTMRRICQVIGVDYHPNLIQPYQNLDQKVTDGIHAESRSMGDTHFDQKSSIDPTLADKWKGVWSDNFLSEKTWEWAKQFGYPITENESQIANEETDFIQKNPESIAIIGMACRVAGAEDIFEFWNNLVNATDVGRDLNIEDITENSLNFEKENRVRRVYSLKNPEYFDAAFFGILPNEAQKMDPQHRIFLENAFAALDMAGYAGGDYNGKIGLYGGVARNEYFTSNLATHPENLDAASDYLPMIGSETTFSISRGAYKLNLRGPAVNVQTACSTGAVAIHLGCQSLRQGDADIVVVGGGRIHADLLDGYTAPDGGPLSADGFLRPFDAGANGMVQGNGMGHLVLKKLSDAQRDGDHIWAVLKGSAINNDGSDKIGFTAPAIAGQADCIASAIQNAGISAGDIGYVEAHGTGTILGDPIEVQGLTRAFRQFTEKNQYCALGSVKSNIGHLDAGAGIMGTIKAALSLYFEKIPATLHFESPNPQIDFANSPFFVNEKVINWQRNGQQRFAGVSSFGLGGTNAHLILEEAPIQKEKKLLNEDDERSELLIFSAKTSTSLDQYVKKITQYIEDNPTISIQNVAGNLAQYKSRFNHRKCLIVNNLKGGYVYTEINEKPLKTTGPITFLFPGGGAQYPNMAKGLYECNRYFKNQLDACFEYVRESFDLNLFDVVFGTKNDHINQPTYALPVLFSVEYSLAMLWQQYGIRPTQLMGHSMGEYAAACISGVITWQEGLSIAVVRGRLFDSIETAGGMISVQAAAEEIEAFLPDSLSIAVINKPDSCVVSGALKGIEEFQSILAEKGIEFKNIPISVAAHSAVVEPILEPFGTHLKTINFQKPTIPFVSNVTGTWITDEEAISIEYWLKHLRQTVRFSDGLTTLFQTETPVFIEVGPGQTLSTYARQHPHKKADQKIYASTRHPKELVDDRTFLLKTIGKLWCLGYEMNWQQLFGENIYRMPLPTYAFDRKKYWIEPNSQSKPTTQSEIDFQSIDELEVALKNDLAQQDMVQINQPAPLDRLPAIIEAITTVLYELSGIEPNQMDTEATFLELGFDSLFLSQVVVQINRTFDTKISFRQLFENLSTIEKLALFLDDELPEEKYRPEPTAPFNEVLQTPQSSLPVQPNSSTSVDNDPNTSELGAMNQGVESLIQQQLQLMQQQLQLLQGQTTSNPQPKKEAVSVAKSIPKPITQTTPHKPTQLNEETIKITRKNKGVTAKMGNYKNISSTDDLTPAQATALQDFIEKYVAKTAKSKQAATRHRQFYADPRSVTGFSKLWKEIVYQIGHEYSKGCKIKDIDGNEYVDFVMSYGVALFGHMPDFVEEAIGRQLKIGNSLDVLPIESSDLARIIAEISGQDRVTLANTGTEAVLGAVRAARRYSGKDKIAVFDTDYHGMIDQFMVRGVYLKDRTKSLPLSPGLSSYIAEDTLVFDYDDPQVLEKLKANLSQVAAVVIEPVQAQNPSWQHFELLKAIRKITAEADVALIFDEVINGFRLSQKGAQGWYDIEADIVAYGKSISGGMPLAAVAGKEKYMEGFDGGLWKFGDDSGPEASITYFASTFIKNPLSVAAAHAAMTEIERRGPELQLELNERAFRFANRIKQIFLKKKAPLYIQNTASIFMIKPADSNPLTRLFHYFLRYEGINIRERPCFLSTAHTEADLDNACRGMERAIDAMMDAGLMQSYEGEDLNEVVPMPLHLIEKEGEFVTSAGQREIFISTQMSDEANASYNIGTEITLSGAIKNEDVKKALQTLVEQHDALRMTFAADGQKGFVQETIELPIVEKDFRGMSDAEYNRVRQEIHRSVAQRTFDLTTGPLCTAQIWQLADDRIAVLLVVHHIVVDGWSLGILTREFGTIYAQIADGQLYKTKKKAVSFTQYLRAQNDATQQNDKEEALDYWKKEYEGFESKESLLLDFRRPAVRSYKADCQRIVLDKLEFDKLKKGAAKAGSTPYFLLLAAFQTLVYRLSNQPETVVGIVAAGQNTGENQSVVGHLANMLPLRLRANPEATFSTHLQSVRGKLLDAFDHQNFTFGELVKGLPIRRSVQRNPLVSVVFNMDSPLENLDFGDTIQATTAPMVKQYDNFDSFINIKPVGEELIVEWFYNIDLFQSEGIQNKLEVYKHLLFHLLNNPNDKLKHIPLTESKIAAFDDTYLSLEKENVSIVELVDNEYYKSKDEICISCNNQTLTRAELFNKSNQVASFLQAKNIGAGTFVGVLLPRNIDLIPVLLGIWKAGAAYLPLDAQNPTERLDYMLRDSGAKLLLTDQNWIENAKGNDWSIPSNAIINLVDVWEGTTQPPVLSPTNLFDPAYIIYTSGSTGQPKGVVIAQETIGLHLRTMQQHLDFKEEDSVFSVISAAFDPSIQDFFLPLISGGKLVLADDNTVKDPAKMATALASSKATWMTATPPTWRMLKMIGWKGSKDLNIISTGEALSYELANDLIDNCRSLWNFYGPTETTIYATAKQIFSNDLRPNGRSNWISIGKSLPLTRVYILDSNRQPLPPNTPGEIYIGGFRVAEGYHNKTAQTATVFVDNPYRKGTKMYQTGDLGFQDDEGNIFYINRKDNQVKIRGYRIELGEIEAKIRALSFIEEAVVAVNNNVESATLVGYFTSKGGQTIAPNQIADTLRKELPIYMIPSQWMQLETFPLTVSGKINRRKLPAITTEKKEKINGHSLKKDKTTQKVANIWCDLLHLSNVEVGENFYDLGGHSLLAVGMIVEIEKVFGVKLPLVTFIENATIEGIAEQIKLFKNSHSEQPGSAGAVVEQTSSEKTIPLTDSQSEIWVAHHLSEEAARTFNVSAAIILTGAVDLDALTAAIEAVVDRHEALRTSIAEDGSTQIIRPTAEAIIYLFDYSTFDSSEQKNTIDITQKEDIEKPFSLQQESLARFTIIKKSEQEVQLVLTMHHIVLDGWSLGVLVQDLGDLYQQKTGQKIASTNSPMQLSDYVAHEIAHKQTTGYQRSVQFWKDKFAQPAPVINWPETHQNPKQASFLSDEAKLVIPHSIIDQLKAKAKSERVSFYSFMLAAFQAYTSRVVRDQQFVLGVSVSGKSIVNFEDLVAHRTHILPMIVAVDQQQCFSDFLQNANKELLTAFDHQDYTLGQLMQELTYERKNGQNSLVNTVFNMETMTREYDFGDVEASVEFIPGHYKSLDLIVHLKPHAEGMEFKWIYKKAVFSESGVERRLAEFCTFLDELLKKSSTSIAELNLLNAADLSQLKQFNTGIKKEVNSKICLPDLLTTSANRFPEVPALTFGDTTLTYAELEEKSNQFANFLIQKGVRKGQRIAICLSPSEQVLVGVYAILKTGATYVPIDPKNPIDRVRFILEDANVSYVVGSQSFTGQLKDWKLKAICPFKCADEISQQPSSPPTVNIHAEDDAYIIYTSGSTGQPKGVSIRHESVLNTFAGLQEELSLSEKDIFYSVSTAAFDMCIPDYFYSIQLGAHLIMADGNIKRDGYLLKTELEKYRPTFMQATPTTWKMLLLEDWKGNPNMKIMSGGEGLELGVASQLLQCVGRLWNGYGPTEATIYTTLQEITEADFPKWRNLRFLPIGRPIANMEVAILDKNRQPVPVGVEGELYIGGPGVATQYLERPALTAKSFLSPKETNLTWQTNGKIYKTGDRVRYLSDGSIEFLGRVDFQLKIRGFRIELGEIEAAMQQQPGIQQAVVLPYEKSGRQQLVGYFTANSQFIFDEKSFKTALRSSLPGYMVPAVFMQLNAFPMSDSAKINRNALPLPKEKINGNAQVAPPSNDTEKQLLSWWKQILKLPNIDVEEDFFELGGHSLAAVGLMAKIAKHYDKRIAVTALFQHSTIKGLAQLIDQKGKQQIGFSSLVPIKTSGSKPPVYLIHGGGLHVLFYQALSKHLDKEQPVYALQAHGLDGQDEPYDRIEDMATHYIKEITTQNPDGPYNLAGYSLGGLITYEMARQLRAMGKVVNMVAMFDAVAKFNWEGNDKSAKWKKAIKKANFNLKLMMRDPVKTAKYKAEVLKMQRLHLKGTVDVDHKSVKDRPEDNEASAAGKKVYENSMRAFEQYVLEPSPIRVDLFKAKEQMFFLHDPEYYGWQHFAENGVVVHELQGNHMNMFAPENGPSLGRLLQQVLDERNFAKKDFISLPDLGSLSSHKS